MTTPQLDLNAPDPGSVGGWGAEIDKTRENIQVAMMFAAAAQHSLPDWATVFTYSSGNLTEIVMTYQTDTSIKMRWVNTYSGSPAKIATQKWYFDKGLGGGYELYTPKGTLTYNYTGNTLDDISVA